MVSVTGAMSSHISYSQCQRMPEEGGSSAFRCHPTPIHHPIQTSLGLCLPRGEPSLPVPSGEPELRMGVAAWVKGQGNLC